MIELNKKNLERIFFGVAACIILYWLLHETERVQQVLGRFQKGADIPYRYKKSFLPEKPARLTEMLRVAEKLSEPFPFVRVDLYEHDGKVVFGELTFTPGAGIFTSQTEIDGTPMGDLIDLGLQEKSV